MIDNLPGLFFTLTSCALFVCGIFYLKYRMDKTKEKYSKKGSNS